LLAPPVAAQQTYALTASQIPELPAQRQPQLPAHLDNLLTLMAELDDSNLPAEKAVQVGKFDHVIPIDLHGDPQMPWGKGCLGWDWGQHQTGFWNLAF